MRTGDVGLVKFRWLKNAEYMELGSRFFGREGNCRFCGEVISFSQEKITTILEQSKNEINGKDEAK